MPGLRPAAEPRLGGVEGIYGIDSLPLAWSAGTRPRTRECRPVVPGAPGAPGTSGRRGQPAGGQVPRGGDDGLAGERLRPAPATGALPNAAASSSHLICPASASRALSSPVSAWLTC